MRIDITFRISKENNYFVLYSKKEQENIFSWIIGIILLELFQVVA